MSDVTYPSPSDSIIVVPDLPVDPHPDDQTSSGVVSTSSQGAILGAGVGPLYWQAASDSAPGRLVNPGNVFVQADSGPLRLLGDAEWAQRQASLACVVAQATCAEIDTLISQVGVVGRKADGSNAYASIIF